MLDSRFLLIEEAKGSPNANGQIRNTLKPFKVAGRIKPWCVSIPPYLSSTAKRQRLYFATRHDALRECDRLRVWKDNFVISLTSMTASRIAEAAEIYNLLAPYGVSLPCDGWQRTKVEIA